MLAAAWWHQGVHRMGSRFDRSVANPQHGDVVWAARLLLPAALAGLHLRYCHPHSPCITFLMACAYTRGTTGGFGTAPAENNKSTSCPNIPGNGFGAFHPLVPTLVEDHLGYVLRCLCLRVNAMDRGKIQEPSKIIWSVTHHWRVKI